MACVASPFPLRSIGWMPLNVDQYLRKTSHLDPQESTQYLQHLVDEWVAKRHRCHIRASKAARARWKLGQLSTSIDDAQADAASIGKLIEKTLSGALRWIGNSQIRSEKARTAARARWSRSEHTASIAQAPKPGGVFTPPDPHRGINITTSFITPSFSPTADEAAPPVMANSGRRAAGQSSDERNPYEDPSKSRKGPFRSFIEGLKGRSNPRSADPRLDSFRDEVLRFWRGMNPDNPECPWIRKDEKALEQLLQGSPNLTFETLKTWLLHRAQSQVNPTDLPRHWLADLIRYSEGPLDRYKHPLPPPRQL